MPPYTLGQLLRERASEKGSAPAYAVLDESASICEEISYADLYRAALRVAAGLQQRLERNSRVLLAYPSGINFLVALFGCALSGMIAVPMAPPKRNRKNERFTAIARDALPACALTLNGWIDLLKAGVRNAGLSAHVFSIEDDEFTQGHLTEPDAPARPDEIAYLQYTSGSIGDPKGVMVTHANILSNSMFMRYVEENDEQTVSLTWLPNFHDMGLAEGLIQPMFSEVPGLIMSPAEFLKNPLLWLEAITRHHVTTSGGPNFAYDLCVEKAVCAAAMPQLDLSGWRVAYNGAEPVRDSTLARFLQTFSPYGFQERAFYPVYGLAEATLVVTSDRRKDLPFRLTVDRDKLEEGQAVPVNEGARTRTLVASGSIQSSHCADGLEVVIVDPSGSPLPDGIIGEVYISGTSVASGYWGRARETAEVFCAAVRNRGEVKFARTGDLGFTWQGRLFLTGRIKDLIIVRGRNIYPQDIEWLAESAHRAIRSSGCAAFAQVKEEPGIADEHITVVCEVRRTFVRQGLKEAAEAVRERVASELEIELRNVVLISPGALPKTSSGKVQRSLCRKMLEDGVLSAIFSLQGKTQEKREVHEVHQKTNHSEIGTLRKELAALFSADGSPVVISDDEPIFPYVRDSLHAVQLCQQIEHLYGVRVPVSRFLGESSIASLSHWIAARVEEKALQATSQAVTPKLNPERLMRLSHGQEALWFLAAMSPDSTAYHIPRVLEIIGELDAPALRRALDLLVARHAALRTRFEAVDGVPHQAFNSAHAVSFVAEDFRGVETGPVDALLSERAWRPFNLEKDSLFRFHLLALEQERHLLLISIHHIVADLWSFALLLDQLLDFYQAFRSGQWPSLPALDRDYPEFIEWQRQFLSSTDGRSCGDFWKQRVQHLPAETALPLDRPRPLRQSFKGACIECDLDQAVTLAIDRAAQDFRTTPFCVMLAAYLIFLHRASGQRIVVVGVPVSGRKRREFSGTIGLVANTIVVSAQISPASTWRDVLAQTHEQLVSGLDAEDYPFVLVTESLAGRRDPRFSPIFQQMFSLEYLSGFEDLAPLVLGRDGAHADRARLRVKSFPLAQQGAQCDLYARFVRYQGRLLGSWNYDSEILDEASVRSWSHLYTNLLQHGLKAPDCPVAELPLHIPEAFGLSGEYLELPSGEPTLHELVGKQVQQTPDSIAVSFDRSFLTFAQLNQCAEKVARALRCRGLAADATVGVCLDRSLELLIVLLGILKSGASYLPIATDYPRVRIEQLLADAQTKIIITSKEHCGKFEGSAILASDIINGRLQDSFGRGSAKAASCSDSAAYVIFTSGSTGRPKGAVNSHRGIVNRLLWMQQAYGLNSHDHVLQKTPYTFDVSVWELFWPLLAGAQIILSRPGGHRDPFYVQETIREREITVLHFVPSMLTLFLENANRTSLETVRLLFCSGEALSKTTETLALRAFNSSIYNLYGPTEAAIDVTSWKCTAEDRGSAVPIGRPIANMTIRLLDDRMQPLIPGVIGNLFIAGVGLAHGYAGRPDLTAPAFLPDPYSTRPGSRLYVTGDQARLRSDRAVEFVGRRDFQVKVRGFRVELMEIDSQLESHPSIASAVVVARNGDQFGTRLTAYYVVRQNCHETDHSLRMWLDERLPEYMIPAFFVELAAMPLLENGKIDRNALPAAASAGHERTGIRPRTADESTLVEVWKEVLGVEQVSVTDTFFEIGGDSLLIVRAATKARARGLDVTVEAIYQLQTIEKICERLAGGPVGHERNTVYRPFSLVDRADMKALPGDLEDAMPLARLQESIVYLIENSENYIVYLASIHLRAHWRPELWEQCIDVALARHPYLRISFALKGFREPLQFVHPHVSRSVDLNDIRHLTPDVQEQYLAEWLSVEKKRRFDWNTPPFFRLTLHRRADDTFQLTFTEVMLDGWSIAVLLTELCRCYQMLLRGCALMQQTSDSPYGLFVQLEREAAASLESEEFWRNKLDSLNITRLPRWPARWRSTDRSLHSRQTIHVEAELVEQLKAIAREENSPLKSVFLAVHLAVLRTLTGSDDVSTELILHGRPETEDSYMSVGLYINTVPIQVRLKGMSWRQLIQQCYLSEIELYPHRRRPFFDISRRSGNPLLNETGFNFTHFHIYKDLLEDERDLEILGVQAFDQTYFNLTAYFNLLPLSNRLSIDLDFNPTEFADEQIKLIAGYYERAIRTIVESSDARVAETPLMSVTELARELEEWSVAKTQEEEPAEALDIIYGNCLRFPDRVAIVQESVAITYGQLRRRAAALSQELHRLGICAEVGVGVLLERSPEFVIALLAILECGGFFVPLDICDPPERRELLIRQSGVRAIIVQSAGTITCAGVREIVCAEARWNATPRTNSFQPVSRDTLAYCIYTSGSTGKPKGVEIPRGALSSFVQAASAAYEIGLEDNLLQFASLCFDVSVEEIFCTLWAGAKLVLRTEEAINSFVSFLDVCAREQLTILDLPTAFWHQLTSVLKEKWARLPGCVRSVTTVGEKANPQRLADWRELVGSDVRLYNAYGPTEATIVSVLHQVDMTGPIEDDFPIGRPLEGVAAYILDSDGQIGPIGREGELCLAGRGLARGYRGRSDLTAERFRPNPYGPSPGSRIYWTGDFVTRRPDGAINFIGRRDAQVKIRGFRIEPGEIESILYSDQRVKHAAVVAGNRDGDGTALLTAYVVPKQWSSQIADQLATDLSRELIRRLPSYMIPAHIEVIRSLGLTRSAKVDKASLRPVCAPMKDPEILSCAMGQSLVEDTLSSIYRASLEIEDVPRNKHFAALGGHSLSAMKMVSRIQESLHVVLRVRDIFEAPNIAALSERVQQLRHLNSAVGVQDEPIRSALPEQRLEISFAQERLWFLHQFDPTNTSYNVPAAFWLRGPLNITALHQAFIGICRRHTVLQMRCVDRGTTAEPVLPSEFWLPLDRVDLRSAARKTRQALARQLALGEAARPFDLTSDNLIRITLVELEVDEYLLIVVMHHIVTDEWCAEIFVNEFQQFYEAAMVGGSPSLPELPIQYWDYARWQKTVLAGSRLEALREFWRRQLAEAPPVIQLPFDGAREWAGPSKAERVYFEIQRSLRIRLKSLGEAHGASLFMVLLGIYQVLLNTVSGMEDIVLGTPIAGRTLPETEKLVGFFANLLVIRSRIRPDVPFATHLGEVRETALLCYDHQELSFAQLVALINPERTTLYPPIVQVIFGMWPHSLRETRVADLHLQQELIHPQQAKYDLEMQIADAGDALRGFLEYNAALFRRETIVELVASYQQLCELVVNSPEAAISELKQIVGDKYGSATSERKTNGSTTPGPWRGSAEAHRDSGESGKFAIYHSS